MGLTEEAARKAAAEETRKKGEAAAAGLVVDGGIAELRATTVGEKGDAAGYDPETRSVAVADALGVDEPSATVLPTDPSAKTKEELTDLSYKITTLNGDSLDVIHQNGKVRISIPNTDGWSIGRKVNAARDMIYYALKEGAYRIGKDGKPLFVIRTRDPQLRAALEAQVTQLGYKFITPGTTEQTRNVEASKAAANAGIFSLNPGYNPLGSQLADINQRVQKRSLSNHPDFIKLQDLKYVASKIAKIVASKTDPRSMAKNNLTMQRPKTLEELTTELHKLQNDPKIPQVLKDKITKILAKDDKTAESILQDLKDLQTENNDSMKPLATKLYDEKGQPKIAALRAGFFTTYEEPLEEHLAKYQKYSVDGQYLWPNAEKALRTFHANYRDKDGNKVSFAVAKEKFEALIAKGCEANEYTKSGQTPVALATLPPEQVASFLKPAGTKRATEERTKIAAVEQAKTAAADAVPHHGHGLA